MAEWAVIFFVASPIAGFSSLSPATSRIARILFFIANAIFVVFLLLTIFAARAIF